MTEMIEKEYNYKIYTPLEIAEDMVSECLNLYFDSDYSLEKLNSLKIMDLSCGSGNLLLTALEKLIKLSYKTTGKYFYKNSWITGYDIDSHALAIFMLKAQDLLKRYDLQGDIALFNEDSLLISPCEKYDIILGNPPYLGEKNNKEVFREIKSTEFGSKYYEAKMDYLYFFIEKGVELLKKDGFLTYLTTNYWMKADSGKKLRECLKDNGSFISITNFDTSLFKNAAGQHNLIFTWTKGHFDTILVRTENETFKVKSSDIYGENFKILLIPEEFAAINENINRICNYKLGDLVNINQGIVTGMDKAFIFSEFQEKFKEYLKPFYKNKDIGKYTVSQKNPFWILYLNKQTVPDQELLDYLTPFKNNLSKRREALNNRIHWWELQWSRDEEIFVQPKIVVRQRCKSNNFAYSDKDFFGSADIYYLTPKDKNINLFYLLGYLNSDIFFQWFKYNGKIKGKNLEFYSTPLKETPVYYPKNIEEIAFIEKLIQSQIENYSEDIQQRLNLYFKNIFRR